MTPVRSGAVAFAPQTRTGLGLTVDLRFGARVSQHRGLRERGTPHARYPAHAIEKLAVKCAGSRGRITELRRVERHGQNMIASITGIDLRGGFHASDQRPSHGHE